MKGFLQPSKADPAICSGHPDVFPIGRTSTSREVFPGISPKDQWAVFPTSIALQSLFLSLRGRPAKRGSFICRGLDSLLHLNPCQNPMFSRNGIKSLKSNCNGIFCKRKTSGRQECSSVILDERLEVGGWRPQSNADNSPSRFFLSLHYLIVPSRINTFHRMRNSDSLDQD